MMNLNVSKVIKKKEGDLTEKEKDNLKETIKDYVVKIFKSEEVNLEQKEKAELLNKLNLPFGRDFFISLLSKNSSNVILLEDNSSHYFWTLIYNCLIYTLKLEETIRRGFHIVAGDLTFSKDKVPVICHWTKLGPVSDGEGEIPSKTSEELEKLDF